MIKKYSLLVLEKAINHALALDETTPEKLHALEGKVLEIIINPLQVNFFMYFHQQKLHLLTGYEREADAVISSSPLGLIRLSILPASKVRSLFNDKIKISGDVELGQQVKKLFDEMDIDWEGHLAQFTGDVVAYQLGSFMRQGMAIKRQLTHSLRHNVTEYLQEEVRAFPPREEINDFFSDVDELTLRVDRLSALVGQVAKEGSK